jgi:hypothetical protein
MKCFVVLSWLAIAVALFARPCFGQGGKVEQGPGYRWVQLKDDVDELALYRGKMQVGNWRVTEQVYRPIVGNAWGEPCKAPFPPPDWAVNVELQDEKPVFNFGIAGEGESTRELSVAHEHIEINGKVASHGECLRTLEKGVPMDADKYRLTIIGGDAERAKVEKDWQDADAYLREKTNVWSVPGDHWSLRDNVSGAAMFSAKGSPTVYFTDAKGTVIYHEDDYQGPSDFQAIRKRVAEYEAKRDPGRFPLIASMGVPPIAVGGMLALGAAGMGYVLTRRKGAR